MGVAFPLSPVPTTYGKANWVDASVPRCGIHYQGDTVTILLTKAGATSYEVRGYDGTIVSSGSLAGTETSVSPTPPAGGWECGWYRVYFSGPSSDALYGNSYCVTSFAVIRNNANFIANPAGDASFGVAGGGGDPHWGNGRTNISEGPDFVLKGVMGIGTSRLLIGSTDDLNSSADTITTASDDASVASAYWTNPGSQYLDPARPRYLWCTFPNGTVDTLALPAGSGTYLNVYAKDETVDGSKVFVSIGAGSVSGAKITVCFPDAVTVVETYDNQASAAAAMTAINTASAYVWVWNPSNKTTPGTQAATAIGHTRYTNVSSAVSTLYGLGVTRFEGPSNEPALTAETAHNMRLFQAAVHAGNSAAKAIGPSPVNISTLTGSASWQTFLDAGGGDYCDEISFHAYNSITNGDLNLGRHTFDAFTALLARYGLSEKTLWQTESTQAMCQVYGVYHPRRARIQLLQTLMMEEYGIVRERNNPWYDRSHGFWDFPAWLSQRDFSVNPQVVMGRTLAEETWGQTYQSKLTFPGLSDSICGGWLYASATAQTCILMLTSALPSATVTLSTDASGPLTIVDAWGNTLTVAITGGLATINVSEIPTYVRLPVGATCAISKFDDWSATSIDQDDAALGNICTVDTALATTLTDGSFLSNYPSQIGIFKSSSAVPSTVEVDWGTPAYGTRLLIWCGSAWQTDSTLLAFTVDVSYDGTTWTTGVASVDNSSDATAINAGSDSNNAGCQYETYWPEQWIFDVPLDLSGTIKKLRINVTQTSLGGEPASPVDPATMGQGDPSQHVVLQRIAVLGKKHTALSGSTLTR